MISVTIEVFGNTIFLFSYANNAYAALSLCSDRLEYKYSKLVMTANKECELPVADSCAIMEGEGEENEEEDEVVYANKTSLLAKLKAITTKVSETKVSVNAFLKMSFTVSEGLHDFGKNKYCNFVSFLLKITFKI